MPREEPLTRSLSRCEVLPVKWGAMGGDYLSSAQAVSGSRRWMSTSLRPNGVAHGLKIVPIGPEHVAAAAQLHEELAAVQFVARGGQRVLRRYYLAWSRTAAGLALVATDDSCGLIGVLLGSLDPGQHYQEMIRRDGAALGLALIGHATIDPRFGRELIATRIRRYSRGLARAARTRPRERRQCSPSAASSEAIGEIALLVVDPQHRGAGIGRALLDRAVAEAQHAGLAALTLVTPPDYEARGFYEHLGWRLADSLTSRSGEPYVLYRRQL